jgi:DNA-binding transcriptional MerR regulator
MKPLAAHRNAALSLADLCEAATGLLGPSAAPDDARIQAVPDARTVRYYQTIGVLDRPVRYEDRQAVYGYRHLLQLVAVKRLQARGLSLAQVQTAIHGRSDAELEAALADVAAQAELRKTAGPSTKTNTATARGTWVGGEVAVGVIVTIDPSRVADPETLLAKIRNLLAPGERP